MLENTHTVQQHGRGQYTEFVQKWLQQKMQQTFHALVKH